MRLIRIVLLSLRDSVWMIFAVLVSALIPMGCLLFLETGYLATDLPYFLFLSIFILILLLFVRLVRSWSFYSEAENAIRESRTFDWRRFEGSIPEARWVKLVASNMDAEFAKKTSNLEELQAERDALVLSWVHHAKTPIAVIRLASESKNGGNEAERISSAARELDRSLDSLLQVVRLDSPEADLRIGKVDIARLARNSINGIRDLFIEREVIPLFRFSENIFVYGDEKLISIVINQLLTNAVKYSPRSSHVLISVSRAHDGKYIEVAIEDEGHGIYPEDIGRVFQPFFTGANGRRGESSTGIGLFLAKRAADAIGAELSLSRRDEGGTVARLMLPSADILQI